MGFFGDTTPIVFTKLAQPDLLVLPLTKMPSPTATAASNAPMAISTARAINMKVNQPVPVSATTPTAGIISRISAKIPNLPNVAGGGSSRYTGVSFGFGAPGPPQRKLGTAQEVNIRTNRSAINPTVPRSPYKTTPIVAPNSRLNALKLRMAPLTRITSRPSPGGTPPPSSAERTTHWTSQDWTAYLNSIPPDQRSISPREVAMSPRIDQSAPTLVAAALTNPTNPGANQSMGLQTDNTVTSDNSGPGLLFFAVAGFALLILLR